MYFDAKLYLEKDKSNAWIINVFQIVSSKKTLSWVKFIMNNKL
jgi:hypothetical protein